MKRLVRCSSKYPSQKEIIGEDDINVTLDDVSDVSIRVNADGDSNCSKCSQEDSRVSSSTNVSSGYRWNDLPGPGDFDPPEYDEPIEHDDVTEELEIELSGSVIVDEDGSWEYTDTSWASNPSNRQGRWYSELYPSVDIADPNDIIEAVDEVIMDRIPEQPGKYPIRGVVTLIFNFSNILSMPGNDEILTDEIYVGVDTKSSTEDVHITY